jgi:NAD(P)-dependent dehydrogenase (short-subunit alcohol dehydrogenase family)
MSAVAVVLISGCSSGIGLATAAAFAADGHDVFAGARTPARATALAELPVTIVRLDVDDRASVDAAVEHVVGATGRVDVLVNNAGVATFAAVEDTPDELLRTTFETNVFGAWRLVRAVVPVMRAQGSGRIVNVSSINGQVSTPFLGAYSASKFALEAMSEALALELGASGIEVTLVQPGIFETAIDDNALPRPDSVAFPGVAEQIAGMRRSLAAQAPPVSRVADAIVAAARADRAPIRVPVGDDAVGLLGARRSQGDEEFAQTLRALFGM